MKSLSHTSEISCPLCGCSTATTISEIHYTDVWDNLNSEWGATFSERVKYEHTPAPTFKLISCSNCQLQYFHPAVPGNPHFYAELTSTCSQYYNDNKWEFDYVRKTLLKNQTLLDVACGKGAFLRTVVNSVASATGIDTNPETDNHLNEANIRIHNESIEEFSVKYSNTFDVVTAFQVIEHLGVIIPFVSAAYSCVKPGGVLVLSVPNRYRRKNPSFDSLDYPPHHISRWSEDQFTIIAKNLNAKLISITKQPLSKSEAICAIRNKELSELLPYTFIGRDFVIKVISRIVFMFPISLIWDYLHISEKLNMFGMSMVATIQKPQVD